MKFIELTAQGFESTVDPVTLNFDSSSICFVGTNGSGKSSLAVYAPTFALFGKVRGRNVTDAINSFSPFARVQLTFEIGGETYKVDRRLPRKGNQTAIVYLLEEDGTWKAITEDKVRSTDEKIIELIGMNYDVAEATWIAPQGSYGSFPQAGPSTRRDILSRVLNLDSYGERHKQFTESAKQASVRMAATQAQISENMAQLDNFSTSLNPLFEGKEDEELDAKLTELEEDIDDLASKNGAGESEIVRARQALSFVREKIASHATQANERVESIQREFHDINNRLNDGSVERARQALSATEEALAALDGAKARIESITERMDEIDQTAITYRQDISSLEEEIGNIEQKRLAVEQEMAEIINKGKEITEGKLPPVNERINELRQKIAGHQSKIDAVHAQEKRLEESIAHGGGQCYACTQPLDDDLLASVRSALAASISVEEAEIGKINDSLNAEHAIVEELNATAQVFREQYMEKDGEKKAIAQEVAQRQQEQRNKRAQLETLGAERTQLAGEQSMLSGQIGESRALGSTLAQQREALDRASNAQRELRRELEGVQARLEQARAATATPQALLEEQSKAQADLDSAQNMGDDGRGEQIAQLRLRISDITAELSARKHARERELALEHRADELNAILASQTHEYEEWDLLRQAFAPTGIPARIMGGVVKELEKITNEYLDKLSGGSMAVTIEPERETKTAGTVQEIFVSVDMPDGSREYRTLSGGQQFRVALALRVALARVSAARRGTTMIETLIVDEGFGALDPEGVEASVQAMRELSEEISVIAVSHVDAVTGGFQDIYEVSLTDGTTRVEQLETV